MELLKSDYTKTLNLIKQAEHFLNRYDKNDSDYEFWSITLTKLNILKEQQEAKLKAMNS